MPKRTSQEPKRKGGRPKGKPLSAKERAQRRAAAVKTGEHASTALGQALPPCKPSVCLEVVAERPIENPRAANAFQLLRQLGHTATDQAITPKSSGERERDQGLGLAGRAAWVSQMRKGLAGEGGDSDA